MTYVRVKQKYQVTIPPKVRKALGVKEGDVLEAGVKDGAIVFHPQSISPVSEEAKRARAERIMSYFGAAKGLFNSTEEIDAYIRRERDAWDN